MKKNIVVCFVVIICALGIWLIFRKETQNEHEKKFASILKDYDSTYNERLEKREDEEILRVYQLKDNQKGYMVVNQGYEDTILMFVILGEQDIKQVKILYHGETEDYGGYVDEQWFLERLLVPVTQRLQTVKMKKENSGDVVAITGATFTTEAVVNGINKCLENNGGIK